MAVPKTKSRMTGPVVLLALPARIVYDQITRGPTELVNSSRKISGFVTRSNPIVNLLQAIKIYQLRRR